MITKNMLLVCVHIARYFGELVREINCRFKSCNWHYGGCMRLGATITSASRQQPCLQYVDVVDQNQIWSGGRS